MAPDPSIAVVVTTISDGRFLDHYVRAAQRYGYPDQVSIYVIGDINTPAECYRRAKAVQDAGLSCHYYGVDEQQEFLSALPGLAESIPFRSDNRRNVGYLLAFRDRKQVIISVDDDNLPIPDSPFFTEHASVGQTQALPVVQAHGLWFNGCSLLQIVDSSGQPRRVYPRGFPYSARGTDESQVGGSVETGRVGVNVGLWLGDPDVDAATRLVTGCSAQSGPSASYFLAPGQRTPINSQNTAVAWRAIPAYYFVRMGWQVGGMRMDRFGDILSGLFLQLCVEAVGDRVRIGEPLVYQARNEHNLFRDLWHELPGMALMEELRPLLEQPLHSLPSYDVAYLELADRLSAWGEGRRAILWDSELPHFSRQVACLMRLWVASCRALASADELRLPPARSVGEPGPATFSTSGAM